MSQEISIVVLGASPVPRNRGERVVVEIMEWDTVIIRVGELE